MDGTHSSGIDPATDRSGLVEFLDGDPINLGLDIVLTPIHTSLMIATNAVALRDNSTHAALWKDRLMPASYTGGFTMTRFDVNGDNTPDYVLATRKGPTIVFIVDGRTGAVTRIRGMIDPAFRNRFSIQSGNFAAGGGTQLLFNDASTATGAVMLIDLATDRLLWSVRRPFPTKLRYAPVASGEPGRSGLSDVSIQSEAFPRDHLVLNGQTGKIVHAHKIFISSPISARELSHSRLADGDGESSRSKQETLPAAMAVVRTTGNPDGVPRQIGKSVPRVLFASRRRPSR